MWLCQIWRWLAFQALLSFAAHACRRGCRRLERVADAAPLRLHGRLEALRLVRGAHRQVSEQRGGLVDAASVERAHPHLSDLSWHAQHELVKRLLDVFVQPQGRTAVAARP